MKQSKKAKWENSLLNHDTQKKADLSCVDLLDHLSPQSIKTEHAIFQLHFTTSKRGSKLTS